MKVKIGKPVKWIGSYQIAEFIMFWEPRHSDRVHNFGKWLSGGEKDSMLQKFCNWVYNKRKQKIKVKVDHWDIWNVDDTLSNIILPLLLKYREEINGSPPVDNEDVPKELHNPTTDKFDSEDGNYFKRWEWIVDELIWTFQQLQMGSDWEDVYVSGDYDMEFSPIDDGGVYYTMKPGPNHTYSVDWEGQMNHAKRIKNGLRLFGKYYQGLWT